MTTRRPDVRDRKAIRAAGLDLHRIASDIRDRRDIVPADDPPGYLVAFHDALREVARICEQAKAVTCADLKRRITYPTQPVIPDNAVSLAGQRSVMALLVTVTTLGPEGPSFSLGR